MDIKKLKKAVEVMEEDLGDALIGTDIYSVHDGQGIIGHESRPAANALFNNITTMIIQSLKDAGLPGMESFIRLISKVGNWLLICPWAIMSGHHW